MATNEQKQWALDKALEVAKKHAEGGSERVTPDYVLEATYETLIKLIDKIEQTQN